MRRGKGKGILVVAGAVTALILGTLGIAYAGHTNVLLFTELNGRNEVTADGTPRAGDLNGRGVAYVFGIDGDPTTLCYVLTVNRIQPPVAAHIHMAPAGSNGPIVVNLSAPSDGNSADCVTEGEIVEGGVEAFPGSQVTAAEILANPSAFYVNVHNGQFPAGAIRGQLAPAR